QFKAPRRSTSCCSALARAPSSVATRRSSCEPIVSFLRWWTTSTGENEPFRETPRETVKRSGRRAAPRAEENHRVELKDYRDIHERLLSRISSVLLGQEEVALHALAALLSGGHILIEGVPGLGKTLLVRVLSQVLGCDFRRIQFTPDLMPS